MSVKILFVVFTIFSALIGDYVFAKNSHTKQRVYDRYSALICTLIFIIAAFRPFDISMDTTEYVYDFISGDYKDVESYDNPGYVFLNFFIKSIFEGSPRWLLIITSLFFPIAYYQFLKQIRTSCMGLALVVLLTILLGFFDFMLSGIKQTIAISFILFSYKYLQNSNFWKFAIMVVIASLFHSTALIVLILYPFRKVKPGVLQIAILTGMFLISKYTSSYILVFIEESFLSDQYGQYSEQDEVLLNSMLIMQVMLTIVILALWNWRKPDVKHIVWLNTMIWAIGFQMFVGVVGEFFRVALYFSLPMAALTTESLNRLPNPYVKIAQLIFIGAISYYVTCMQEGYFTDYLI